jgi:predicted transcriptional regulator
VLACITALARGAAIKGIRIRLEQEGIRTSLFDLEADIMEVVWEKSWAAFSVSDVHEELERQRQIAYTTVMTTVNRLAEKELLRRERDGRRYLYHPCMNREEFLRTMTRTVLGRLPAVGHDEAVAYLVEQVSQGGEQELLRLEALIQERQKAMRR